MNRKWIVYLVSFAAFMGPFTQTIYTPILPEVTEQMHTTPFVVNLTISIFTFFLALMQMIYGPLTDTKGRRKVLLFGVSVYILASIGCFLSHSIYVLLAFRALQAVGIAAGSVVAVTVIGDLFDNKSRGKAMGTFQMMVSLGPVLGPVIGGFLGGILNFHSVFLALVLVGVAVLALHYLFLKETKPETEAEHHFSPRDFGRILRNRTGSSIIYLGFIQYYSFYSFLVFLPNILSERYGMSAEQKGIILLPMSLAIVLGNFLGGRIQEWMERRRVLVLTSLLNVAAIFYFLLIADHGLVLLVPAIILFGLFLGLSLPVQTTLLTLTYQQNRATAVGVYNFFRYCGMGFGPLLGSVLLHLGGYPFVFGFVVLVFLAYSVLLRSRLQIRSAEVG
jgi:multidrug resistance protein